MGMSDAASVFEHVSQLFHDGKYGQAEAGLHQLLAQDMNMPVVQFMLGCCMMASAPPRHAIAQMLFERVVASEKDKEAWRFVDSRVIPQLLRHSWNNLGVIHRAELRKATAERCLMQGLGYTDRKASIYANLSALHINDGTPHQCIKWADKALESAKADPNPDKDTQQAIETATWNKGHALLELGRWKEAWPAFNTDLRSKEKMHRNYHHGRETPWWDGGPGKTVVLFGEQGLGDEILFASCIPDALKICKQVILHPGPRLEGFFARSFPGAVVYGGHEKGRTPDDLPWWIRKHEINACLPLGHLPTMYRNADADFPRHQGYMTPDPALVAEYRARLATLGPRPKIGLSWQGGAKDTRIDYRSVRPELLKPFVQSIPAEFISLQYSNGAFAEAREIGIPHWIDAAEAEDMDQVAALIAACDLVVTVCTTAVHVAGSMNIPCFVMVPDKPAWRYQIKGSHMAWYPSVRLFRQENADWGPLLEKLKAETCSYLNHIANKTRNSMPAIPFTAPTERPTASASPI